MPQIVLSIFLTAGEGATEGALEAWDVIVGLIPKLLGLGTTYLNACLSNPLYAIPIAVVFLSLGAWVVSMFLPGTKKRKK